MNPIIAGLDRVIVEVVKFRAELDPIAGHRAALARGSVDGAIVALRQARRFLESPSSGTWTKTT